MKQRDGHHRAAARRQWLGVLVGITLVASFIVSSTLIMSARGSSAAATNVATLGHLAPSGEFTTTANRSISLERALGHQTTMVWFVVAGCASCAVSIPAVALKLRTFAHDGVKILVLDLYGDLPSNRSGERSLTGFGRAAAGKAFSSRVWTWGLASKSLSYAYDPTGSPDQYFLLNAQHRIVYEDSVPVSTMPALLREVMKLHG